MANTRSTLQKIDAHVEESMGGRRSDARPKLSPVSSRKDSSRRPIKNVGTVAIDDIVPDPRQPRRDFSEEAIAHLAESIRDKGQLHPIRVRWSDSMNKWVIISGERRWRACKRAKLDMIVCCFHDGDLTESDILEEQLIENLLRKNLNPIEEATAFATLIELNGWSGKQLAEILRIPAAKVSRTLALLRLPTDVQQKVESGQISARSAYEISRLPSEMTQRQLAGQAAKGKLSYDQAARAVRQRKGKMKQRSRGTRLTFLTEEGWKITVSAKKRARYEEIEEALCRVLEDVRHRIKNNVQLI